MTTLIKFFSIVMASSIIINEAITSDYLKVFYYRYPEQLYSTSMLDATAFLEKVEYDRNKKPSEEMRIVAFPDNVHIDEDRKQQIRDSILSLAWWYEESESVDSIVITNPATVRKHLRRFAKISQNSKIYETPGNYAFYLVLTNVGSQYDTIVVDKWRDYPILYDGKYLKNEKFYDYLVRLISSYDKIWKKRMKSNELVI